MGRFPENAESAESADSAGIFAIFGEIFRGVLALSGVVFDDPAPPPLGKSIFPTCESVALSNAKGAYLWRILAGVHPCLRDGAQKGFRKTRKVPKARNAPGFSLLPDQSTGAFWRFLECVLTAPVH